MKIMIVEDDCVLRASLAELLMCAEYEIIEAASLSQASTVLTIETDIALYLVDLMLEDGSGLSFIRALRDRTDAPIIILTALDDEDNVISGLSAGADDYVTKPFRARELLARIEANLRRSISGFSVVESGSVTYSQIENLVLICGNDIPLRKAEQLLLDLFLKNPGRLLKREFLLYHLWDRKEIYVEDKTLTVLVSRLRKALRDAGGEDGIETIRGIGYRWKLPVRKKG